jgi:hypothetical protein
LVFNDQILCNSTVDSNVIILSSVIVNIDGFLIGFIGFIDHSQVANTNKHNTVAGFRTLNNSTLRLLSLLPLAVAG